MRSRSLVRTLGVSVACLFVFRFVVAQGHGKEVESREPGLLPYISIPESNHHAGRFLALDLSPTLDPVCVTLPTTTPFQTDGYELMTIDQAGALNVSYGGKGDASAERNRKVMVRELSKYNECDSTDGKFVVQYGAAVRLGVLSDDIQGKFDLNFVIVAANATLNSYHFEVKSQIVNFQNGDTLGGLATDAINLTNGGLSTENYATFAQKVNALASAVSAAGALPSSPLIRIGFRPKFNQDLRQALSMSFALPYIATGQGCLSAIHALNGEGTDIEKSIRVAYVLLNDNGNDCDASDLVTQAKAKVLLQLLNGKNISAPR
jgi:hypothetical protein